MFLFFPVKNIQSKQTDFNLHCEKCKRKRASSLYENAFVVRRNDSVIWQVCIHIVCSLLYFSISLNPSTTEGDCTRHLEKMMIELLTRSQRLHPQFSITVGSVWGRGPYWHRLYVHALISSITAEGFPAIPVLGNSIASNNFCESVERFMDIQLRYITLGHFSYSG
jgi:hypothetical protein